MFNIEDELSKLPDKPGVYIMKDSENKIIYVGKAVSLRKRVRQYFRKNNKTARIERMVSLISYFEYIIVDNEQEALILECNLIKENRPKFNVLLKDDKTYPYIKIDITSDFPGVFYTRKILKDKARYFGPYANPGSAKEMLDFIKEKYQIRQCKILKNRKKPCLNYHIKKCLGPCMGYVTKEVYNEQIQEVISLLEGKIENVLKDLDQKMKVASSSLDFETAAKYRDKKISLENAVTKQKVSNISENNIDVIGVAKLEKKVCVEMFFVRGSKMIGKEHYFYDIEEIEGRDFMSDFLKQYYIDNLNIPNKIMIRDDIEDRENIEKILSDKLGKKVEIKIPKIGEKFKFVELAQNNAKLTLENKHKNNNEILDEFKNVLGLEEKPRKIECFDISNLSGEDTVAAMCVMVDGKINKKLSRKFRIKTVYGQDDPKATKEVVGRRINQSLEGNEGFGRLPDLIFADGGITQIRAIKESIKQYNLSIPVYGMVKDDKHRTRALIDEEREEIELSQKAMNLITVFQDTVHNTAITYHRKLRDEKMSKSELDDIKGIGDVKKQELLKEFGSVKKIKEASIEKLIAIKGITKEIAEKIKEEK